ncbi:MAG: hypothetical protein LBF51_10660 [Zoogloeaceae bacterium]|jgi:type IV pilus assembly protein PilX|nr:hypothetical protein [Zoogloeaceae bacterium]
MKTQKAHERGFTLVMGVVVLVVMALLSVTSIRGTMLQERLAGSFAEQNQAFQAAESALRYGQKMLADGDAKSTSEGGCLYAPNTAPAPDIDYDDWMAAHTCDIPGDYYRDAFGAEKPIFFIERQESGSGGGSRGDSLGAAGSEWNTSSGSEVAAFRITALGMGGVKQAGKPTILVVLQSSVR